ncbi:MAG: 3-hydroxyacyl-ACP dehydratase FabZ [Deltaproteobacteria bacterium]|nr:3-hydroxyacyl-ACP dehydratase FabZ [Deltaproteobacteria bacterium]
MFDSLTALEIRNYLPHRYPFLLVDKIEKVIPGSASPIGDKIIGYKAVTQNEPYFNGHFPGQPVMPGVLILEALAQTAALLIFYHIPNAKENYYFYLAGIDEAKFRHPVFPGSLLQLEVEIKKIRSLKFCVAEAKAFLAHGTEKELVAQAQISSALVPQKKECI